MLLQNVHFGLRTLPYVFVVSEGSVPWLDANFMALTHHQFVAWWASIEAYLDYPRWLCFDSTNSQAELLVCEWKGLWNKFEASGSWHGMVWGWNGCWLSVTVKPSNFNDYKAMCRVCLVANTAKPSLPGSTGILSAFSSPWSRQLPGCPRIGMPC